MNDRKTTTIGELSPEIIIKILHHCEYPTILRFAATSKAYLELVTKSISLQLHIELEADGLELVKGSFKQGATYSVILEDLKRFRDAWFKLDIDDPIIVRSVGKSEMLLWELREGFYIKAFSESGNPLANAIQFVPLDSETPKPPPLKFDFMFAEFTADPGQELVATISKDPDRNTVIHIHLRSSVTGIAHPLAQHSRLTAEFDYDLPVFSSCFAIEIMGHIILAKVSKIRDTRYDLLIWNWKSGALLNRISSRVGICDFAFLDQRHLVVLSTAGSVPDSLALLVYVVLEVGPTKDDFDAPLQIEDTPISQPILRLEFPRIKESARIADGGFFLRSDPTPGRIIHTKSAAFACPYARTLSMTFCFRATGFNWGSPPFYRVFIDGRTLIDYIGVSQRDGVAVLPWSSWGTNATRWFVTTEGPSHWICWMSGSKYIRQFHQSPYYCIFDFSPSAIGRFSEPFAQIPSAAIHPEPRATHPEPGSGVMDLDHLGGYLFDTFTGPLSRPKFIAFRADKNAPSSIHPDDYLGFDEIITSRLPYRLVCKANETRNHEGWQINGDCIIGVFSRGLPSETVTIYKLKC